jgi:hypothetical protein
MGKADSLYALVSRVPSRQVRRRLCRPPMCDVIGGEFLDDAGFDKYARKYLARLKAYSDSYQVPMPKYWGFHP